MACSPFVDPLYAAQALAKAASDTLDASARHDVLSSLNALSHALEYFSDAWSAARNQDGSPSASIISVPGTGRAERFQAALRMIDPKAQNIVAIANATISACYEVEAEHGVPIADPAIRLLASHLGWACNADTSYDLFAFLVGECHRQARGQGLLQ